MRLHQERKQLLDSAQRSLFATMTAKLLASPHQAALKVLGTTFEFWTKASSRTSTSQLDQFLAENSASSIKHSDLLPWDELRDVLNSLPTKLS